MSDLICPKCHAIYRIDLASIRESNVCCERCGTIWSISEPGGVQEPDPAEPSPEISPDMEPSSPESDPKKEATEPETSEEETTKSNDVSARPGLSEEAIKILQEEAALEKEKREKTIEDVALEQKPEEQRDDSSPQRPVKNNLKTKTPAEKHLPIPEDISTLDTLLSGMGVELPPDIPPLLPSTKPKESFPAAPFKPKPSNLDHKEVPNLPNAEEKKPIENTNLPEKLEKAIADHQERALQSSLADEETVDEGEIPSLEGQDEIKEQTKEHQEAKPQKKNKLGWSLIAAPFLLALLLFGLYITAPFLSEAFPALEKPLTLFTNDINSMLDGLQR